MLSGILLTVTTGIIWTLVAAIYSTVSKRKIDLTSFMFCYSLVFALTIWIFQFPQAVPFSAIVPVIKAMIPASLLGILGFLALFAAMDHTSHAVAWTFTQSAMILPFTGGWLLFGNQVKWFNLTGLILIVAALAMIGSAKKSASSVTAFKGIILCTLALMLTGISQLCTLIPGETGCSEAALSWRLPVLATSALLTWSISALFRKKKITILCLRWGIIYGIVVAAGQISLYMALDHMSTVRLPNIVYPTAISTCIVLFAIYCAIVNKEKLPWQTITGILLIILGVSLLTFT